MNSTPDCAARPYRKPPPPRPAPLYAATGGGLRGPLGSDLYAFQLVHLSIDSLVYASDLSSALRGLGGGILAHGNFTPDSYIKLTYYTGELTKTLSELRHAYQASDEHQMNDSALHPQALKRLAGLEGLLQLTQSQVIDPDTFTIRAADYYRRAGTVVDTLQQLHRLTEAALVQRIETNIQRQTWQMNEVVLISLAISLLVLYLFAGFYLAMKRGIHQINDTLAALAQGDLSRRAEVSGRDEIRAIADNLNQTAVQLNQLVRIAYTQASEATP